MARKCNKKLFRVETTIKRCENYKPKGDKYKLIDESKKQTQTQTHDRGTSPPPSHRSPPRSSTSSLVHHEAEGTQGQKSTYARLKQLEERERARAAKRGAHYNPDEDDDDIAFDVGKDRKQYQKEIKARRARALLSKARRNTAAVANFNKKAKAKAKPTLMSRIRGIR